MKSTPPLRPRRAEQVPSALADGCDPAAGCSAAIARVLMCASTVASPKSGPLLHVSAHLPLKGRGNVFPAQADTRRLLPPQGEGWDGGGVGALSNCNAL